MSGAAEGLELRMDSPFSAHVASSHSPLAPDPRPAHLRGLTRCFLLEDSRNQCPSTWWRVLNYRVEVRVLRVKRLYVS